MNFKSREKYWHRRNQRNNEENRWIQEILIGSKCTFSGYFGFCRVCIVPPEYIGRGRLGRPYEEVKKSWKQLWSKFFDETDMI